MSTLLVALLALVLFLVAFMYGVAPLGVRRKLAVPAEADLHWIGEAHVPPVARAHLREAGERLELLGFRRVGILHSPHHKSYQHVYLHDTWGDCALATSIGPLAFTELSTEVETGLIANTADMALPSVFGAHPGYREARFPQVAGDTARLVELHRRRVLREAGPAPAALVPPPGFELERLRRAYAVPLRHQAEIGLMAREGDVYRLTLRAAYRMTWSLLPPVLQLRRAALRRHALQEERALMQGPAPAPGRPVRAVRVAAGGTLVDADGADLSGSPTPQPGIDPVSTPDALREAVEAAGLAHHADEILAAARPCIRFGTRRERDERLPPGASRLGGDPDLPPDTPWPAWEGEPLAFLGQIDLREVAGMPGAEVLPADGWLSFFFVADQRTWGGEPTDAGSWRVIHTPASSPPLVRRPAPAALAPDGRYTPCRLLFAPALSLPTEGDAYPAYGWAEEDVDAYSDLARGEAPYHQLLGWPEAIQGDVFEECDMVLHNARREGILDDPRLPHRDPGERDPWVLLLQLDSDDRAGMMWGDTGALYFCIRESDLAARDFTRVWMILQCC